MASRFSGLRFSGMSRFSGLFLLLVREQKWSNHTIGMILFSGLSQFSELFCGDGQSPLNRDNTVLCLLAITNCPAVSLYLREWMQCQLFVICVTWQHRGKTVHILIMVGCFWDRIKIHDADKHSDPDWQHAVAFGQLLLSLQSNMMLWHTLLTLLTSCLYKK